MKHSYVNPQVTTATTATTKAAHNHSAPAQQQEQEPWRASIRVLLDRLSYFDILDTIYDAGFEPEQVRIKSLEITDDTHGIVAIDLTLPTEIDARVQYILTLLEETPGVEKFSATTEVPLLVAPKNKREAITALLNSLKEAYPWMVSRCFNSWTEPQGTLWITSTRDFSYAFNTHLLEDGLFTLTRGWRTHPTDEPGNADTSTITLNRDDTTTLNLHTAGWAYYVGRETLYYLAHAPLWSLDIHAPLR